MADLDFTGGIADLLGGFGGAVGSILGDLAGDDEREQARRLLEQTSREWGSLDPRVVAERETAVNLGPSAYEDVGTQLDPTARDAQLRALSSLMETGLSGGMDAQSRARMAEATSRSAQQESAARQALQQQAQARGMGRGMSGYAAQLAAQQGAAQRLGAESVQAAGDASQRALAALAQSGTLAGQVRGADYQQAGDRATARDAVARFNAANQQGVQGRNIDRNMNAQQQTFNNRVTVTQGAGRARGDVAGTYLDEAERSGQRGYAMGSLAGRGLGYVAGGGR